MSMQTIPDPVPATALSRRAFISGAIAAASVVVSASPAVVLADAAYEVEQDKTVDEIWRLYAQMAPDDKVRFYSFIKWRVYDGRRETCPDAEMLAWMDEHA